MPSGTPTTTSNVMTFNRGDKTTDTIWAKRIVFNSIHTSITATINEGSDTITLFRIFVNHDAPPSTIDFGDRGFRFEGGLSFNGSTASLINMYVFLA